MAAPLSSLARNPTRVGTALPAGAARAHRISASKPAATAVLAMASPTGPPKSRNSQDRSNFGFFIISTFFLVYYEQARLQKQTMLAETFFQKTVRIRDRDDHAHRT